jgi:hypothetical protein
MKMVMIKKDHGIKMAAKKTKKKQKKSLRELKIKKKGK